MLQEVLVAVVVVVAALYAAWRLPGPATRLKLSEWLARRLPGALGVAFVRLADRQREALRGGGCGACGGSAAPSVRTSGTSRRHR